MNNKEELEVSPNDYNNIESNAIVRSLIESQADYLFNEYNKKKDMKVIYDEIDRFNSIKSSLQREITILARMASAAPVMMRENIQDLNEFRIANRKLENEIYFHNEKISLVDKKIYEDNRSIFMKDYNENLNSKVFEKINEEIREDPFFNKQKAKK